VFRWLLLLYPARFRSAYGGEMRQVFRDQLRWDRKNLWRRTLVDCAKAVVRERSSSPMSVTSLIAYTFCVAAMFFIGRFELHTDDTGVVVGFVLLMTAILGALVPRHAWRWAIAGWCVPAAELFWGMTNPNMGGYKGLLYIALFLTVIGLIGAYSGAFLRRTAFGKIG
jgi:hypothetical protein